MALPKRPFDKGDPEVMIDINTTPLIDVMLVLLVMLIITIPIQLHAVNLELPVGAPPDKPLEPQKIRIDIDERNQIHWQGLPVELAELEQRMHDVSQMTPQPEVHLRPDKDCAYQVFANLLSTSKRQGLRSLAVIGAEQFVQ